MPKSKRSFTTKDLENFLKAISMNESSGGQFTNHEPAEYGVNKGATAIGQYGLMPNTVREEYNRMGSLAPKDLEPVIEDDEQLRQFISQNPDMESMIAKHLASRLLSRTQGNPGAAAVGWRYGSNLPQDRLMERSIDDPYVKKFYETYKMLQPKKAPSQKPSPIQKQSPMQKMKPLSSLSEDEMKSKMNVLDEYINNINSEQEEEENV